MSAKPAPPDTLVAAGAGLAHGMLGIFGAYPVLLSLLIANLSTMGLATWFLLTQENYRHLERLEMIQMLKECVGHKP